MYGHLAQTGSLCLNLRAVSNQGLWTSILPTHQGQHHHGLQNVCPERRSGVSINNININNVFRIVQLVTCESRQTRPGLKHILLRPVWPDWAIFESSWQQNLLQKKPKWLATFWAILKNLTLM